MKKTSKKHLVLKRNTLKALTELPNTAYRHVVGGDDTSPTNMKWGGLPSKGLTCFFC